MNRVLQFIQSHACPHCTVRHQIEQQLAAAHEVAASIRAATGDSIDLWIPDAHRFLKPKSDPDPDDVVDEFDEVGIRLIVATEPRLAALDEPLRAYCVSELRRMSDELAAAADRIEGGSTP